MKDEHHAVKLMLKVLESICSKAEHGTVDVGDLEPIIGFLKGFVDKCHHGKEEDILFPERELRGLSESGGPIEVILQDHQQGRAYIKEIDDAFQSLIREEQESAAKQRIVDSSRKYIELLSAHIEKENHILFQIADKLLDETSQENLYERFEILEEERIGLGKHEEYHELLRYLAAKYLKGESGHHHH